MKAEEVINRLTKMLVEHRIIYNRLVKGSIVNYDYKSLSYNAGQEDTHTTILDYIKYLKNEEA